MPGLTDSVLLASILGGSFGAAFVIQKAALHLMFKAMDRR